MTADRNIVEILRRFPLNNISEEWVKSVWESDFTEAESLDEAVLQDLDTGTLEEIMDSLLGSLESWISEHGEEGLWTLLVESEIPLKSVVALLSYFLVSGHKKSSDVTQKVLGILAGRCYCKLLMVPGSRAFNIFHPELYEKSLDYLKQYIILGSTGSSKRKRSITPMKSSQGKRNKKSKKKKQGSNNASLEEDMEVQEFGGSQEAQNDDDEEEEVQELAPQEILRLRKHLFKLLMEMFEFLEVYSLRQSVSSSHHSVQVLAPLTRHDAETFDGNFEPSVSPSRMSVPCLAFKCLQALCSQLHGHVSSLTNATCKALLPNLLMLIGDKSVQTVSKLLQTIRDHAVDFVCMLMKKIEERGLVSVRTLVQHMCTKVPDRAEYRTKVAHAVVTIAKEMPQESYSRMVLWFYKLSKHNQMNNRGFALEIVSALLAMPERPLTEDVPVDLRPYTTHRSLFGILLNSCSDKAPSVRSRAITCFAQCLSSADERVANTMKDIVTPVAGPKNPNIPRLIRTPGTYLAAPGSSVASEDSTRRSDVTIAEAAIEGSTTVQDSNLEGAQGRPMSMAGVNLTPGFDPNLSDSEGVFSMLRRRVRDEKVNVRKSAIQALEAGVRFEMPNFTKVNVEVLKDHCRDPGLSVRKQALQSLTDLLVDFPQDKYLQSNWLLGCLPLVIDRESTLSEKCMESLEELILSNVVLKARSNSESHALAWSLLGIIAKPQSVDQRRYLQKACHHWSRQGKIKPALISALESHIGTENNAGAWMLLAEIAPAAPKIKPDFLLNYWERQAKQEKCSETMNRVLTVMKYVAKYLPSTDRSNLIDDLKARLMRFNSPPEQISVSVATLAKMCNLQAEETGVRTMATQWSADLLEACDKYLSKVVLEQDKTINDEDMVVCHLFTLGEVVQLCPGKVPKRVFLLVQSMIAAPCITSLPASQSQPSSQTEPNQSGDGLHPDRQSQPGTEDQGNQSGNSPTSSSGDKDHQSASLNSLSSGDIPATQFTQGSQPLTQFRGSVMSSRIRAFAFIALGKLCLQNEGLAKKCIAALARELETSKDAAIRNNVVIIMCDLCVRYTTTANHYISNIATCLKDPTPLVRKQTLTLITRLLQEDFLKWKGSLFYRFISALLDECEEIRKFGEFCLLHQLIQRHPNMFFQHFMECLFHFNDYREHSVYNRFSQSDKDRELFSLKGDKNAKKRLTLYKFLLENMSDDHRFQLQSKLVQEVLGGIVDSILPINKDTSDILKDALAILGSKEIKLSSLKVRPSEEMAADEQEMAAVVVATAKKTIITQVLKKNVIENIVPIVVSLKHMMEKQRSPLLKELMMYLRELMKDYKSEVKEILSADHQLATEIEFDLRKFEEQQQETARRRSAAPSVQGSPVAVTKSPVPGANLGSPPPIAGGSPRMAGSPRTPPLKGGTGRVRGVPGTKGTPPVMRLHTGRNTPAREAPLATVAMLNSARRLMSQLRVNENPNQKSSGQSQNIAATPKRKDDSRNKSRAISTPSVALSNITFHGDANTSFVPPSPIAETSANNRIYESDDNVTLVMDSSNKENDDNVLIMEPLQAGANKPRVWNVSSPAPKKMSQRQKKGMEDQSSLAEMDVETTNWEEDNIKRKVKSKQRSRLSDTLKQNTADQSTSVSEKKTKRGKRKK